MEFAQFLKGYRSKSTMPLPEGHSQRVEACLAVQIHTTGARPAYESSRGWIKPETYHKKYDKLFQTRLLNRHPNESPSHYNWRLSVYSPVAKELFDKFSNLCKGSILQPNNFSISGDERLMEWAAAQNLSHEIAELMDFILQNPYGYIAVIPEHEYGPTEAPEIDIVAIPYEDVLMDDGESVAFRYEGKLYFVDSYAVYEINKTDYIEKPHQFGEVPVWSYHNSFLQPYQFWSDSLVRNMNDDEAMVQHYSYPIVQVVEQECTSCHGQKQVVDTTAIGYDPHDPTTICHKECSTCNGKGTISRNPGDFYTISEETLARNGGTMQDMAKFITPDVGIPEYHLKRWQTFYERVEASLHLRSIQDGTQSGEAKREDRKDQYYFLQTVSSFVFAQLRKGLRYVSGYLNPNGPQPVYIIEPKQFDLMSDSDLVNEFAMLQAKTDDSQTLSELAYIVNSKVFRDDPVQGKITEVLYLADPLYGVAGAALRTKILSGVYTQADITLHEKGYKMLVRMADEMTPDVFKDTPTRELVQRLTEMAQASVPAGIYTL